MATRADMKARIISETMRPDLGDASTNGVDAVTAEINSAIKFYQGKRLWFTEQYAKVELPLTVGQGDYDKGDDADIGNLIRIDAISLRYPDRNRELSLTTSSWIDGVTANATNGDPYRFAYYGGTLRLYPPPSTSVPLVISGVLRVGAPNSDDEPNNPWMNEAEELIRSRAKSRLYANNMLDPQMAQVMTAMEAEALFSLQQETSSRTQVSRLEPCDL